MARDTHVKVRCCFCQAMNSHLAQPNLVDCPECGKSYRLILPTHRIENELELSGSAKKFFATRKVTA